MRTLIICVAIVATILVVAAEPFAPEVRADAKRSSAAEAGPQEDLVTTTGKVDRWSVRADGTVHFALRGRGEEGASTLTWFRTPRSRDGEARFAQLVLGILVEASSTDRDFPLSATGEADLREDGEARDAALVLERLDHVVGPRTPRIGR